MQPTPGDVHVDGYGGMKLKKKKKKKRKADPLAKSFSEVVEIWKDEDADLQIVYGVALAPERVDSQGDTVTAKEIEKAAHRFLVAKRQTDVQHSEEQVPVDVIESYIAPQDLIIAGQPVTKGSWVMAHKINDRKLWKAIRKGTITGLSIGGTAIRSED